MLKCGELHSITLYYIPKFAISQGKIDTKYIETQEMFQLRQLSGITVMSRAYNRYRKYRKAVFM